MSRRRWFTGLLAVAALLGATLAGCSSTSSGGNGAPSTVVDTTGPRTTSTIPATTSAPTTLAPTTTTDPSPTAAELAVGEQFVSAAQALLAATDMHAISVSVRRDEQVLAEVAFGTDTTGAPLTGASQFRLASISKILLAVAVLQLAEQDAIDLDATLAEQWKDSFAVNDARVRQITVRQLLQHTSGLDPLRDTFFVDGGIDWHRAADIAIASELLHPPGTGYRYSNANFVLLGRLVEQVTATPVHTVIAANVLAPLGITTARLNIDTHSFAIDGPQYVVGRTREYMEALGPAGSWEMSAHDTATVLAALQFDAPTALLSPEALGAMLTPITLADDEETWTYALGMMVGGGWWGHTGTIEDVATFAITSANGYTVVVLTASDEVGGGRGLMERFYAPITSLLALPAR